VCYAINHHTRLLGALLLLEHAFRELQKVLRFEIILDEDFLTVLINLLTNLALPLLLLDRG
jgi:hypothetical protein